MHAKSLLDGVDAPLLGPVLNQVRKQPKSGYYAPQGKRRARPESSAAMPAKETVRRSNPGAIGIAERSAGTTPQD
jgi:hypothetical protein